jgi:hypothetical protein
MVVVAAFAASATCAPPGATITDTCWFTRALASDGSRV